MSSYFSSIKGQPSHYDVIFTGSYGTVKLVHDLEPEEAIALSHELNLILEDHNLYHHPPHIAPTN